MAGGCAIFRKTGIKKGSPSFLIVSLRYIGDVLVTTPLALSIKKAIPGARVEYLVFQGTEAVLAKNPYVNKVHVIPRGSKNPLDLLHLIKRFDVALGCNLSDRSAIAAALTGRRSIALYAGRSHEWWKRLALDFPWHYDDSRHAIQQMLSLLEPLGIPKVATVTMAFDADDCAFARARLGESKYILLHPYSRGSYKYWSPERWGELARLILLETDCLPVFTMTGDPGDAEFLDAILAHAPDGCRAFPERFSLAELAAAIKGSAAYVGIDTVVTHVAAAVGAKVVALLGPTYTRYWAPWPNGCTEASPFAANRGVQRVGGIAVAQKDWSCVPCNKETCSESSRNRIECLAELESREVFEILRISLNGEGAA